MTNQPTPNPDVTPEVRQEQQNTFQSLEQRIQELTVQLSQGGPQEVQNFASRNIQASIQYLNGMHNQINTLNTSLSGTARTLGQSQEQINARSQQIRTNAEAALVNGVRNLRVMATRPQAGPQQVPGVQPQPGPQGQPGPRPGPQTQPQPQPQVGPAPQPGPGPQVGPGVQPGQGPQTGPNAPVTGPNAGPNAPVQIPAGLDSTLHDAFRGLSPAGQNFIQQALAVPQLANRDNQVPLVGVVRALEGANWTALVGRVNALPATATSEQITQALGAVVSDPDQQRVLTILAQHGREAFRAPTTPQEGAAALPPIPNREALAAEAAQLKTATGMAANLQRVRFIFKLVGLGVDLGELSNIWQGDANAIKPCPPANRMWNLFVAVMAAYEQLSGGRPGGAAGPSGSPEQARQTPQQQAESINNMPFNTLVTTTISTVNGVQQMVITPKPGAPAASLKTLQDRLVADMGGGRNENNLQQEGGKITIKYMTAAKIQQVQKIVGEAIMGLVRGRSTVESTGNGLSQDEKDGILQSLERPNQWTSPFRSPETGNDYEYISANGKIYAQHVDGDYLYVYDSSVRDGDFVQVNGKYFNGQAEVSLPDEASRKTFKKEGQTRTWETMTAAERKTQRESIRKQGTDYITSHGGEVYDEGYIIDMPGTMYDLQLRFNEGNGVWEWTVEDQSHWRPTFTGRDVNAVLQDNPQGDGTWNDRAAAAATNIIQGLHNINHPSR